MKLELGTWKPESFETSSSSLSPSASPRVHSDGYAGNEAVCHPMMALQLIFEWCHGCDALISQKFGNLT
jgi:hypothetical protein